MILFVLNTVLLVFLSRVAAKSLPFTSSHVFTWSKRADDLRVLALDGNGLMVQFDANNDLLSDGITLNLNVSANSCFDVTAPNTVLQVRDKVAVVVQSVVPPCVALLSIQDGRVVDVAPSSSPQSVLLVGAGGSVLQLGAHGSLTVSTLSSAAASLTRTTSVVELLVPNLSSDKRELVTVESWQPLSAVQTGFHAWIEIGYVRGKINAQTRGTIAELQAAIIPRTALFYANLSDDSSSKPLSLKHVFQEDKFYFTLVQVLSNGACLVRTLGAKKNELYTINFDGSKSHRMEYVDAKLANIKVDAVYFSRNHQSSSSSSRELPQVLQAIQSEPHGSHSLSITSSPWQYFYKIDKVSSHSVLSTDVVVVTDNSNDGKQLAFVGSAQELLSIESKTGKIVKVNDFARAKEHLIKLISCHERVFALIAGVSTSVSLKHFNVTTQTFDSEPVAHNVRDAVCVSDVRLLYVKQVNATMFVVERIQLGLENEKTMVNVLFDYIWQMFGRDETAEQSTCQAKR